MLRIQRKERFVWAGADRKALVKLLGEMVSLQWEGRIWTFRQEERAVEKMYALGVDLEKRQRGWVSSGEEGTSGGKPSVGCG